MGGTQKGLNRFDRATEQFHHYKSGIQGVGRYSLITEDSSGALWLASWGGGLQRFDPVTGQFTVYRNVPKDARSLSSDHVHSVYVDHSGTVWAGTDNGLNRLDQASGIFTVYSTRDGLPNNSVVGILEDERGRLWLGTRNGLSRFDPDRKAFTNYSVSDGLPADEFNFFLKEFKSRDNELFFASQNGLVAFYPERVVNNPVAPPVFLTDFELFGTRVLVGSNSTLKQSISFTQSITLQHWQNIISFEFSALSYAAPERNRYRYKLEGLDKEWNQANSARRFATYTTLPPREYLFRVQASDAHGAWNEEGASLRLVILPPWWDTWQFRSATLAFMLLAVVCIYRLRIRSIERQLNVRLEARVDERLRVARELHDTLLQSFNSLLPRFQSAYNLLPGRVSDAMQVLQSAVESAFHAITEARDAVQNLRSSVSTTNDLAGALETLGEELSASETATNGHAAAFSVEIEGTPLDLHPILRDEIYRMTAEALRNAFHHARARRIEVDIRYGSRELSVRVRDDGTGIDRSILGQQGRVGHFGLQGMRERAEQIGGKLEVWSEDGAGTEVELTLPASVAYGRKRGQRLFMRKVAAKS